MGWSKWRNDDELDSNYEYWKNQHGIYQIRVVDAEGRAIHIPRIGGTDEEGIIYIGRSGKSTTRTNRSLGARVWEFLRQKNYHSGSEMYHQARPKLLRRKNFTGHQLQFRVMSCEDSQIERKEKKALRKYFNTYCELPPCNSAFPGK